MGQGTMRLATPDEPATTDNEIQPALLMLSHVVPQPSGSGVRRRAWELLERAARTHDVYLAALVDGRVDLALWRSLHAATAALTLEAPARFARRWRATLQPHVNNWSERIAFDAFILTHPRLWRPAANPPARVNACDMQTLTPRAATAWRKRLQGEPTLLLPDDTDHFESLLQAATAHQPAPPLRRAA